MKVACLAIGLFWTALACGEEVLYRLPWPDGLTFMFTQAPGGRITSHFTKANLHAVDIAIPEGVPVLAARSGVVAAVEAAHGARAEEEPLTYEGNFVRVHHGDGTAAIYAHLKHRGVVVTPGETVAAGQPLGYSGATGDVLEPQLHFAVVRSEGESSVLAQDVSQPITFYVGVPAVVFRPRTALRVTANYSAPAEPPRAPSEGGSLAPWKRPTLSAGEEARAWVLLGLWLFCGLAAVAWFWRFSKD